MLCDWQGSIILFHGKMPLHMLKTGLEVTLLYSPTREGEKEILLTLQTL